MEAFIANGNSRFQSVITTEYQSGLKIMAKISPSLWDFSTSIYQAEAVARACLELQDRCHWNIPLALFCCWAGKYHGALSSEQNRQARDFAEVASIAVVQQLRELRRGMKYAHQADWPLAGADWETLREQIKALELRSEQLLLEGLERQFVDSLRAGDCPVGGRAGGELLIQVVENIKQCLPDLTDPRSVTWLAVVLRAVFNHRSLASIKAELKALLDE